jgi:hypothetical protein
MLNPHDTPGKQQVAYYALSKKVSTKAVAPHSNRFFRTFGATGDGNLDEFDMLKVWANMLIWLRVGCRRRSH